MRPDPGPDGFPKGAPPAPAQTVGDGMEIPAAAGAGFPSRRRGGIVEVLGARR